MEAEELLIHQYKTGERFQQYRRYPGTESVKQDTDSVTADEDE